MEQLDSLQSVESILLSRECNVDNLLMPLELVLKAEGKIDQKGLETEIMKLFNAGAALWRLGLTTEADTLLLEMSDRAVDHCDPANEDLLKKLSEAPNTLKSMWVNQVDFSLFTWFCT